MQSRRLLLPTHRLARIVTWARLMLGWIAALLGRMDACAPGRRILDQGGFVRLVRDLIVVRAAEIAGMRVRRLTSQDRAPPGFRQRREPRALRRAAAGARLRRALNHRDAAARISILLAALADIDAFARRFVVPRAMRGLTRLRPLRAARPPREALCSLAAPTPFVADSS